eukprot:TRINITY_DN11285_c0_g1_i1.p1 TRINITY_DN11285_c0_g1~~TRINITY_DN11285_c0_g1_i1.p1  ORF type:complete len:526 (-),score=95.15 TRINITY_DN11285_c0_g1_i1:205-1692(-)
MAAHTSTGDADSSCDFFYLDDGCRNVCIVARGWAMRRGHCKRLEAPTKCCSADEHDNFENPRKDVKRGRSVFKRSVGKGYQKDCRDWESEIRNKAVVNRRKLSRYAAEQAEETLRYSLHTSRYPESEGTTSDEEVSDDDVDVEVCLKYSDDTLSDVSSTEASTFGSAGSDSSSFYSCSWEDELEKSCRTPTPWEMAIARAEQTARMLGINSILPGSGSGSGRRKREKPSASCKALHSKLRKEWSIYSRECDLVKTGPFQKLRTEFLEQNLQQLCSGLRQVMPGNIALKATPLAPHVRRRFLEACNGELQGKLECAFHGTEETNLESIYAKGLLVPGQGNHVKVANGNAHGQGIYTAKVTHPFLSYSFAKGIKRHMLICGVLDDAEVVRPRACGNFIVTKESANVRHVSDAIVVFDPVRVAPLFDAYSLGVSGATAPLMHSTASRDLKVIEKRKRIRGRLKTHVQQQSKRSAFFARLTAQHQKQNPKSYLNKGKPT